MTSPASNAPALVNISDKVSATPCGTFQGTYQVINYSEDSTVWIGNRDNVRTNVGLPVPAQSAVTVSYATLYATLDSAATDPALLVIGGQVQGWAPSPVKVVNISGPVDVTGTVGIDGTVTVDGTVGIAGDVTVNGDVGITGPVTVDGSVDIASGTVDATITGPVDINSGTVNIGNTPGVFPLVSLTSLLVNSVVTPSGSAQLTLTGLSAFNALILSNLFHILTGAPDSTQYQEIDIQGFTAGGILIYINKLYLQGTYGVVFGGTSTGSNLLDDLALTTIPLNGIDKVVLQYPASFQSGVTGTVTVNAYGTNQQLPASHRSQKQISGPIMFSSGAANISVTTLTGQATIAIPITNNAVSIYAFSSGSGSGSPSTTIAIEDSISNRVQPFVAQGIAKSSPPTQWQLPHSLNPMFFRIQETVAGTTSAWQILITEDAFPAAA
jgi:cytoskeletal protein CcmA (bactofilin family)